ncbi:MAG TPA: cation:dicarboxylase symporter family transporter [Bryobacteraceae bacterium]|nr:cation:dicarboxylase symporter family transporter [Bryobacteraceae bacterium]
MKHLSLTAWIFIGMAAGIAAGFLAPGAASQLAPVSNIFLRLIKSIIAPLLFGTLVAGIASTGSIKAMGRIGLKAIIYFEIVTTLALFVGLAAVNIFRPGDGMRLAPGAAVEIPKAQTSVGAILEHTFPASIIDAMARGEVLQIVVFCFLFAAAAASIGPAADPVIRFAESLAEVMFRYTKYVMYLAPLGVGAAMAVTVSTKGIGVLYGLGKLIAVMYAAQIFFVVAVLGAVIVISRIPLRPFLAAVREPFLIAFSTSTSEAALPRALENMERFGVPKHIVGFVMPTGYSFNLDGSTLYLSLASVFVAQAAGIEMPIGQQLLMLLTLMLTSKGVAGVPRAALVILAGTLGTFGLPLEGAAVLLGVDAVLDMARTSVNVTGNCLATAVIARWEGYTPGR